MMKQLIFFFFLLMIIAAQSLPALSNAELYERSELWPPYAKLRPNAVEPTGQLAGLVTFRGTVIRLNPDKETVLLDYGRKGIHCVRLESTDILEQAEAYASEQAQRPFPLLTYQMGRKLLLPSDGQVVTATFLSHLAPLQTLIYVYFEASQSEALLKALAQLGSPAQSYPELEQPSLFVLVPQGAYTSQGLADQVLDSGAQVAFFRDYLAPGYTTSLHHEVPELPACVVTDENGKLSPNSSSELTATLRAAMETPAP
jgi:hypothetical protein